MAATLEQADRIVAQDVAPDTVIFQQDEPATHLYVIESGSVRLTQRSFLETFVVEELGQGNVFGEMAMVDQGRHLTTATVLSGGRILRIHRDDIAEAALSNPRVAERLFAKLGARLAYTHFRLSVFSLRHSQARLMLQLRYEVMRAGDAGRGAFVPIPYDLHEVLAAERGTVLHLLDKLVHEGLVEVDGNGHFRIPDQAGYDRKLTYLELRDRFE
jgi:CRP/FNR family cyclic AMP-dependent transcriptional regulator